jgi:hypothetical protein
MKHRNCLFTVLTAALMVAVSLGCSPYSIKSDFDSEANYAGYRSFAMYERSDLKTQAPLVYKRIARAITREMEAKGNQEVPSNQADLLIAVHGSTKRKVETISYTHRHSWSAVQVHEYKEGTLVIDIVDRQADELIWRGTANGVLRNNPGEDDQKVAEVVSAILAKYPPQ